ncbi:hypothetical protein DV736_g6379, partial [Chaetothyriales sp. CBS 134916]
MDAGGLAQMTFPPSFENTRLGVSGPGYASRGKGSNIKRLSVAPPKISTIDENACINGSATPRTARGHLLAGLRTAPKSATTAPVMNGLESSKYADSQYNTGSRAPRTTTAASFPAMPNANGSFHSYAQPEQILAPPAIDWNTQGADSIDQDLYDELVATNHFLAQQQRALQQQLLSITQTAQQFGNLQVNTNFANPAHQYQSPVNASMSLYQQQCQQGMQPVVQPVPGSPGVFAVYNPMTGQSSYVVDHSTPHEVAAVQDQYTPLSPQTVPLTAPPFQRHVSDPSVSRVDARSSSPPKRSSSPQKDVEPLPPPSANAFRRGHRKNMSSATNIKTTSEWVRPVGPRSAVLPPTPMTGTFGPGLGRAGEHPVRQPRGPPLLQELEQKPTAKHEGSKNFATRQRRRAVHNLVRAGRERRNDSVPSASRADSPSSENDFNFSVSSDNDSVLAGSTSLTSQPSLGSLQAIGSERKEKSRERSSVDSSGRLSTKSLSSDEGSAISGSYVEVDGSRRSTPLLVLSSAEMRKNVVMT